MRALFLMLPLLVLSAPVVAAGRAQTPLALRADDWCPHTCAPGDGPASGDGYLVDLVRAALPQRVTDYRLENWARLRERQSAPPAPLLVVLGVARSERNEDMYLLTRAPLSHSPYCFFTRPGLASWRYEGPDSLRRLRLAVTHGYEFDDPALRGYLREPPRGAVVQRVSGDQAVLRHVDMLQAGRSDVVLEDREAMRWAFRHRAASLPVQEAGCISDDTGLYIGLPRRDPRAAETLAALEAGLQRLRRSGEMARILARYGIKPS
jgi:polar amino acid transport system substrate-binding protein